MCSTGGRNDRQEPLQSSFYFYAKNEVILTALVSKWQMQGMQHFSLEVMISSLGKPYSLRLLYCFSITILLFVLMEFITHAKFENLTWLDKVTTQQYCFNGFGMGDIVAGGEFQR